MTGFESKRQAAQDKMELADAYASAVAATPNMPTPLERKLAVERIERARNALEAALEQQQAEPVADGDKVICPACCHQFRAIPETVQTLMLHAGFEPPFTTAPKQQAEPDRWVIEKVDGKLLLNGMEIGPGTIDVRLDGLTYCSAEKVEVRQQAEPAADEAIHAAWSAGYVEGEKAALEQQQAEPVAHVLFRQDDDGLEPIMFYPPKTAPNPRTLKDRFVLKDVWLSPPPQHPWVGLTVTTILNMMPSTIPAEYDGPLMEFARAIEAKLKERNT